MSFIEMISSNHTRIWQRFSSVPVILVMVFMDAYLAQAQNIPQGPATIDFGVTTEWGGKVDPMAGKLTAFTTDFILPGNGGLDIVVGRFYNSQSYKLNTLSSWSQEIPRIQVDTIPWAVTKGTEPVDWSDISPMDSYIGGNPTGNGLCLRPDPPSTFSTVANFDIEGKNYWSGIKLYIPGNAPRELLSKTTTSTAYPSDAKYVTADGWIAKCITTTNGPGFQVHSPDGVVYTMDVIEHVWGETVYGYYPGHNIAYASEVRDSSGNYLTYSYLESNWTFTETCMGGVFASSLPVLSADTPRKRLGSISSSDGRYIDFDYQFKDGCGQYPQLDNVEFDGKIWDYQYGNGGLVKVVLPDGSSWDYQYNETFRHDFDANNYLDVKILTDITTPLDGKYVYAYNSDDEVKSRTVKDSDGSTIGSWSYTYSEGSTYNTTTITGPEKKTVSQYTNGKGSWRYGYLYDEKVYDVSTGALEQTTTNTWQDLGQLGESEFEGEPNFPKSLDHKVVLTYQSVSRDGSTFNRDFNDFDSYGMPKTIVESGNGNLGRTLNYTYINKTSNGQWILGLLNTSSISNVSGSVVQTYYDSGLLESVNSYGVNIDYTYDTEGNIDSITDANGNVTYLSNYYRGIPETENHPESIEINRNVNYDGTVDWVEDGAGYTTHYEYDDLGRQSQIRTPRTDDSNIDIVWDLDGTGTRTLTRGSLTITSYYDGLGRLEREYNGTFNVRYEYDAHNRITYKSDPYSSGAGNYGTAFEYDAFDRITKLTHTADSTSINYTYLANNRVQVVDEEGNSTIYEYDAFGTPDVLFLERIEAPEGQTTVIERLNNGLIDYVTQGGITHDYGYNSRWQLTTESRPETGTVTYGRDTIGNMTSRKQGSSPTTIYNYDGRNRLDYVDYPSGTDDIDLVYDDRENIRQVIKGPTAWLYNYDANNNLKDEALGFIDTGLSFKLDYAYDARDSLSSITYPTQETVSYSPNFLGLPTKVGSYVTGVTYHPNMQIDGFTFQNSKVYSATQNSRSLPENINSGPVDYTYYYDAASNVTDMVDLNNSSKSLSFVYDGLNRLDIISGDYSGDIDYDALGNITSKTLGSQSINYAYNSSTKRLDSVAGGATRSFGYDVYGNVTSNGSDTFYYDDASNLVEVTSQNIDYLYDGTGRRVRISEDGAISRYSLYNSAGQLVYEYEPVSGNASRYYYLGRQLVAKRDGGVTLNTDLDNDGVADAIEIAAGANANSTDTDGDGMADSYEYAMGLDPLNNDSNLDHDGDSLTNLQEFILGTDPFSEDTDEDGIPDDQDSNPLLNIAAILIPIFHLMMN